MSGFKKIHFNALDASDTPGQARLHSMNRDRSAGPSDYTTTLGVPEIPGGYNRPSPEKAGREYLQTFLEDAGSEALQGLTTPSSPALVPDLGLADSTEAPALASHALTFEQSWKGIPVFGGRVSVDVRDSDRTLISINGQLATPPETLPTASLSPAGARTKLEDWAASGTLPEDAAPRLTWYYKPETDIWHLTWHFAELPLSPPGEEGPHSDDEDHDHRFCLGPSPRTRHMLIDALVDAANGEVVYYFPSTAALHVPIPMSGQDVDGRARSFFGVQSAGGFALSDPLRNIATYDFAGGDIDQSNNPPLPPTPVEGAGRDLSANHPAAVSAHYNSTKVFDFFNDELKRNGVDDKGMQLVSVVNVWSSLGGRPHPEWPNAVWWQKRMWYGTQASGSFARHLDIIAHELTHGITESSSRLVYRDLPGALNESFSDIFGVVVANWYPNAPEDVSTWNWKLGVGLGRGGGPLRDLEDPAAAGQPDHMSQYVPLPPNHDHGGVHIYSGIHNKAIHHLFIDTDASGDLTFPTREAVLILYLTLLRLTRTSDFSDCRRTMENVTRAYYGPGAELPVRLDAIDRAYGSVGL